MADATYFLSIMRFLTTFILFAVVLSPATPLRADEVEKAATDFDPAAFRAGLAGKWKLERRQGTLWSSEVYDYRADGTFSVENLFDVGQGQKKISFEGTWQLDGKNLIRETTKTSDTAAETIGHKISEKILSFSANEWRYVVDNNPAVRTERRVDSVDLKEPSPSLGYTTRLTGFYQEFPLIRMRMKAGELTDYSSALETECLRFFSSASEPVDFNIAVIVRPGKRSRIWIEPASAVKPEWLPFVRKLEALPSANVIEGPVAFVIMGQVGGGVSNEELKSIPMPASWKEIVASKKDQLTMDEMFDIIWPDENAPKEPVENLPLLPTEKSAESSAKPADGEKKGE